MPELSVDFQSLPPEYQQVIQLAEEQHNITIAPLQLLVGGWSGAVVYLVSVSYNDTKKVEHCILKLDRKSKRARTDEVTRHNTVMDKSTPQFARDHIAELVCHQWFARKTKFIHHGGRKGFHDRNSRRKAGHRQAQKEYRTKPVATRH